MSPLDRIDRCACPAPDKDTSQAAGHRAASGWADGACGAHSVARQVARGVALPLFPPPHTVACYPAEGCRRLPALLPMIALRCQDDRQYYAQLRNGATQWNERPFPRAPWRQAMAAPHEPPHGRQASQPTQAALCPGLDKPASASGTLPGSHH